MAILGLVMKSRHCRDSLSDFAQSVQRWIVVPRKTVAFGQASATRASTDRPPFVGLRALPVRGSLRDLQSE